MKRLPIPYVGVDYYFPSDYFTDCPQYTWLKPTCYANRALADSPRRQLISDLKFIRSKRIVRTLRVWISLDELMNWNPVTGFSGFTPTAFPYVDDMLWLLHRYHLHAVLVLLTYAGKGDLDQFQPQALDGEHPQMRAGYLQAVGDFMSHLAASAIDRSTAPIIELQNEPYYQLEQYFSDPTKLGTFTACQVDTTQTDTTCVDEQIIHPWLNDLYQAATQAAPQGFYYSFSDTGRMFSDYAFWSQMFPGNIINEHVYDSTPWLHEALYAQGLQFQLPWIVTEAGCDTGAISCTYSGSSPKPDRWWLDNLSKFGAQSVMIESAVTMWRYPNGANSQTPTVVGRAAIATIRRKVKPVGVR